MSAGIEVGHTKGSKKLRVERVLAYYKDGSEQFYDILGCIEIAPSLFVQSADFVESQNENNCYRIVHPARS